jgi:hypothetical protein
MSPELLRQPGGYLKWSASGGWRSGACCGSVLTSKSSLARRSFRSRRRFRHSASLRFRFMDTPSLIEAGFAPSVSRDLGDCGHRDVVSALLREPGGFEGVGVVPEVLHAEDAARCGR